jgi:hypothetical protein
MKSAVPYLKSTYHAPSASIAAAGVSDQNPVEGVNGNSDSLMEGEEIV